MRLPQVSKSQARKSDRHTKGCRGRRVAGRARGVLGGRGVVEMKSKKQSKLRWTGMVDVLLKPLAGDVRAAGGGRRAVGSLGSGQLAVGAEETWPQP